MVAGVEGRERRSHRRRAAGRCRTSRRHPGHRSARRDADPDREGARREATRQQRNAGRPRRREEESGGLAHRRLTSSPRTSSARRPAHRGSHTSRHPTAPALRIPRRHQRYARMAARSLPTRCARPHNRGRKPSVPGRHHRPGRCDLPGNRSDDTADAADQAVPGRENHSGGPNLPNYNRSDDYTMPRRQRRARRPTLPHPQTHPMPRRQRRARRPTLPVGTATHPVPRRHHRARRPDLPDPHTMPRRQHRHPPAALPDPHRMLRRLRGRRGCGGGGADQDRPRAVQRSKSSRPQQVSSRGSATRYTAHLRVHRRTQGDLWGRTDLPGTGRAPCADRPAHLPCAPVGGAVLRQTVHQQHDRIGALVAVFRDVLVFR